MNTSTMTAGRSVQVQAVTADARQLSDRIARRAAHALLAWSRRRDEQRTHSATAERRWNEQAAARLQADEFRRVTLMAQPLI